MATSEIENYIYLLSQGLDSGGEGRFTLNKLPRSKALLDAAETLPHRWVYFAVQSAVCARASSLRVGSNATSVSVEFEVMEIGAEFLQPDLLVGESSASDPAVSLWAQAVLWASATNPASIEILCEGMHGGYRVTILGEKSSRVLLTPRPRRSRLALLVNFGREGARRAGLSAHLEKNLARDLAFANIPVRLEGAEAALGRPPLPDYRRVALCLADPGQQDALGFVIPSLLNFREYHMTGGHGRIFNNAPLHGPRLDLSGKLLGPAVWSELRTSWNNLSLHQNSRGEWLLPLSFVPKIPDTSLVRTQAVAIYQQEERPSRFYPVHQGLSLTPIDMDEVGPGWSVYWPAPAQATDYVGLSAVQDNQLANLKALASEWLKGEAGLQA